MKQAFKYFWLKLKPFFLLFLACETVIRAVLMVYAHNDIAGAGVAIPASLLVGFAFDLAAFAYFLIPLGLYFAFARQEKKAGRIAATVLFFIVAYVLMFCSVSEFFFWDEFQSRYNFIAVDYLVYTNEVIGNIRESYPVGPVMSAIALAAAALSFLYYRRSVPAAPQTPYRLAIVLGAVAVSVLSFFTFNSSYADISANRYLNEIAHNGVYQLFSAFRNNELSYDQFYATLPREKLVTALQTELGITAKKGAAATPENTSPLDHTVKAKGADNRYNLVLITVESLSAEFLATFGNKQNLTPNLDKLANDSLFFTNLYATGTRTVYGLSAITLGMPPVAGNAIVRQPGNGKLASLGSVLRDKGYSTKFIYGGFGYFDNMNAFFSANGYDVVDRNSLSKEEINFANVWGVADDDLYRRVLKENDKEHAAGRPFFDMVMTTTNHRPYTYPEGKIDIPSHTGRPGGVKYTDYAIHDFLQEAKKKPWFDNTIFVIVADHTAGSAGKSELDPSKYHIPMFIYAPGIVKRGKVDWMASQIDIAPTLLGLMGISYESRFYGKDLMKTRPGRAFVSNYQKLGYLTEDGLVILSPVRQATFYNSKNEAAKLPADKLQTAIAYFQGASQWRNWSKQP